MKGRDQFLDLGVSGTINQYLMVRVKKECEGEELTHWVRMGTSVIQLL